MWFLTAMYVNLRPKICQQLWSEIRAPSNNMCDGWAINGDFSTTFGDHEREVVVGLLTPTIIQLFEG